MKSWYNLRGRSSGINRGRSSGARGNLPHSDHLYHHVQHIAVAPVKRKEDELQVGQRLLVIRVSWEKGKRAGSTGRLCVAAVPDLKDRTAECHVVSWGQNQGLQEKLKGGERCSGNSVVDTSSCKLQAEVGVKRK